MSRPFTLQYWIDNGWYVGRLREVPGVFSPGQDAGGAGGEHPGRLHLMTEDETEEPRVG